MIIDQLENAALYYGLGERMATALRYLQQADPATLQPGRYEVDGTDVYAMVQHYDTKPRDKGRWEAHRRYFDIQFLAEGTELMGFANIRQVTLGDYDEVKDFQALQADGEFVLMRPGAFVILAPHDAHMPGMAVSAPQPARKIVMKVRV
jgi:YhcH/YjgK/YiaL family protein